MHAKLSEAGKSILKGLLSNCNEKQQEMFKLMYGRNKGRRSVEDAKAMEISDVVDQMEEDKISNAIGQCERTIEKIWSYKAPPAHSAL